MELSNQEKIKTFRENETYKYSSILEADTIKQVEMKKKLRKCIKQVEMKKKLRKYISGELKSNSRQNYVPETLSKE